ncbi:Conidiation-specific protein 10, partial [Lachnellula arida]
MASTNPGNFANRPTPDVQAAASKGGLASQGSGTTSASTTSDNPGNFANRPTEEVREIASKGGQARAAQLSEPEPGNGNPGNFANRPTEE